MFGAENMKSRKKAKSFPIKNNNLMLKNNSN